MLAKFIQYSDSEDSNNEVDEDEDLRNKEVKNNEDLQIKFENLKQRRNNLKTEVDHGSLSNSSDLNVTPPANSCSSSSGVTKKTKTTKNKRKASLDELNKYMPDVYQVNDQHDPYNLKKSKLEQEVDEAVEAKNYDLAETLNNEICKREFATRVKGAMEARDFIKKNKASKEGKRKKKTLKWTFNRKQRWETKGNM